MEWSVPSSIQCWNMRRYCFGKGALVRVPSAPISTEAASIRHPLEFGRKAMQAALLPSDERGHEMSGCYGVSTTLPMLERPSTISCASRAFSRGRTLLISTFSFPSAATLRANLKLSGVSIGFPKIVMTLR